MKAPLVAIHVAERAQANVEDVYILCPKCALWLCLADYKDAQCPTCGRFNDEAAAIQTALENLAYKQKEKEKA